MKSDVVKVTNSGEGINEALCAADAAAVYRSLEKKDALYLRLLAEEMMSMMRSIAGEMETVILKGWGTMYFSKSWS